MFSLLQSNNWWRVPAFLGWIPIFFAGYFPEWTFHWLRDLGGVVTQRAITNSHYTVSLACAAYVVFFTYWRCRNAGDESPAAQGKAIQLGIVALLAFLPMRMEYLRDYFAIPVAEHRRLLLFFAAAKTAAWLYLFLVILRYYAWGGDSVFQRMQILFPSVKHSDPDTAPTPLLPDAEKHRETASPGNLSPPESNETDKGKPGLNNDRTSP